MLKALFATASVSLVLLAPAAEAAYIQSVITFNGTAPEGQTVLANDANYSESGYTLAIGPLINDEAAVFFADNSTPGFPGLPAFNDDVLEFNDNLARFLMTKADGGVFDLLSVETGSLGGDAFNDGNFVFTGFFQGGGSISRTLSATAPGVTLNTFTGFVGLASLLVTTTDGYFPVLDNLTVAATTGEVPEPSGVGMIGIGLAGLAAFRRRKPLQG